MQTRGRNTRLIAMTTCYERFQQAAMNPFLSSRERQQITNQTFEALHRLLDEEYSQGYLDGGEYATEVSKKILKGQL